MLSDLCTQNVMQRNIEAVNGLSTKIEAKFLQMIDS